jgi:Beta-lactamase enzyme family
VAARLAGLERRFGARLGVFKVLAAAAILRQDGPDGLARHITYSRAELVPPSPVTTARLRTGMTLGQLCQAAVSDSHSTAANLLLRALGGPGGVTAFARTLGDHVTRLDRTEPYLNEAAPGDPATRPHRALTPANRSLLTRWLVASTTAAGLIRAAVPAGWTVGDKPAPEAMAPATTSVSCGRHGGRHRHGHYVHPGHPRRIAREHRHRRGRQNCPARTMNAVPGIPSRSVPDAARSC